MPSLLRGAVVAGAVALAIVLSTTIGLASPWPVLLTAAVALVGRFRAGPVVALLIGAAAWWLAMALRAGVLPDTSSSEVLAAVVAIAICTVAAAVSSGRLPLPAALAGGALFAGIYEPIFADAPTQFLTDSFLALGSLVVAVGLGAVAAAAVTLIERISTDRVIVLSKNEGVA